MSKERDEKLASYIEIYDLLSKPMIQKMVAEISRELRELNGNSIYTDEHIIQLAALKEVATQRKKRNRRAL